jgi:hypothetical protein
VDFLAKLKAMLGGGAQNEETGEVRPDNETGEAAPWNDPSLRAAPIRPMAAASPAPAAPPVSPIEDAVSQAVALEKQRNKVKMLAPDWLNR